MLFNILAIYGDNSVAKKFQHRYRVYSVNSQGFKNNGNDGEIIAPARALIEESIHKPIGNPM